MKIKILFFGIAKDITGVNALDIELNDVFNSNELKDLLKEKYSKFNRINDFSLAVNEAYIDEVYALKNNDVVAIIPPVSGG
ncbi:MAG: molybdopterin synthase sulfur carrier subunit [Flavobacteriaceae bacterium]|nr:molybdopterin synthase sulfur carrier subunit [Flavobacteriaceae bacterium]